MGCNTGKFSAYLREGKQGIWQPKTRPPGDATDFSKYGVLDVSQFSELELRMWLLIGMGLASKMELDEYYTLDEALKLFALYRMRSDIEAFHAEELKKKIKK